MNKMATVLREKGVDELRDELLLLRRELFNLRMQKAVQQNTKGSELRRVRHGIARALTILGEKEQAGEAAAVPPKPAETQAAETQATTGEDEQEIRNKDKEQNND